MKPCSEYEHKMAENSCTELSLEHPGSLPNDVRVLGCSLTPHASKAVPYFSYKLIYCVSEGKF